MCRKTIESVQKPLEPIKKYQEPAKECTKLKGKPLNGSGYALNQKENYCTGLNLF